jgi:fatty acid desaturase
LGIAEYLSEELEVIDMGWLEFLIVMVLILTLIAAILFWQMRSFRYAVIFGLLFVVAVFAMMNGPLGDQIRKEMQEDKAAASQVKRTG